MTLGLALDGLLAVLLLVTIRYCALLYRRLEAVRAAPAQMQVLAQRLGEVAVCAEAGLTHLRAAAEETASDLEPRVERAKTLSSDLDMLCHRAGKLADRLESIKPAAAPARSERPRAAGGKGATAAKPAAGGRGTQQSRSEHALIEALRASR